MSVKLNQQLVKKQGLTSADEGRIPTKPPRARQAGWAENQYALQRAWGFPEDPNYHRAWWIKGCTCPKMDNDDNYPTGYSIKLY